MKDLYVGVLGGRLVGRIEIGRRDGDCEWKMW